MSKYSYGMDDSTAQWWAYKTTTLRWGDGNTESECLRFGNLLDGMISICNFRGYKYDKESIHLYSKFTINNISSLFGEDEGVEFYSFLMFSSHEIVNFLATNNKLPHKYLLDIVMEYSDTNKYYPFTTFEELIDWKPCLISSDTDQIKTWCLEVIKNNPKPVSDYKSGKLNALNSLKGQVMKISKGKADMTLVENILKEELTKS